MLSRGSRIVDIIHLELAGGINHAGHIIPPKIQHIDAVNNLDHCWWKSKPFWPTKSAKPPKFPSRDTIVNNRFLLNLQKARLLYIKHVQIMDMHSEIGQI
jgi:hypothetical protein